MRSARAAARAVGRSDYVAGTLFGVPILGIIQVNIAFSGAFSSWWTRIVVEALPLLFCLSRLLFVRRTPKKAPAAR